VGDSIQEQEGLAEQMTAADGLQPGTVILLSKNGKIRDNLRPATRVSLVWALDEEHLTVITATLGGGGGGQTPARRLQPLLAAGLVLDMQDLL